MTEFIIIGYTIIAVLWFWYLNLNTTRFTNWKCVLCWTVFLPCTLIVIVVVFSGKFIGWCKKEF